MIKNFSLLAVVGLVLMVTTESESWGQGFGGYHRAAYTARSATVARGVNVGVRAGAYRPYGGLGYGYGGYGRALPYGSYGDAYGNVYLPPAPGKGPVGMDSIKSTAPTDLRASSESALDAALNQMKLPSDAGLPAGGGGGK